MNCPHVLSMGTVHRHCPHILFTSAVHMCCPHTLSIRTAHTCCLYCFITRPSHGPREARGSPGRTPPPPGLLSMTFPHPLLSSEPGRAVVPQCLFKEGIREGEWLACVTQLWQGLYAVRRRLNPSHAWRTPWYQGSNPGLSRAGHTPWISGYPPQSRDSTFPLGPLYFLSAGSHGAQQDSEGRRQSWMQGTGLGGAWGLAWRSGLCGH